MQMYYYLEALVQNTELTFEPALLKTIFELFFDLIVIFVKTEYSGNRQEVVMATHVAVHMMSSDLIDRIHPGLEYMLDEDKEEMVNNYRTTYEHLNNVKQSLQNKQLEYINYGTAR